MAETSRERALARIAENVRVHGAHIYVIPQEVVPRFAYTIGVRDVLGAELILAGAIHYMAGEVGHILNAIRQPLCITRDTSATFTVETLGTFTLRKAHPSWTKELLLGATDYYGVPEIDAYQVVPDADHITIDVPDLGVAWDPRAQPIWQWLSDDPPSGAFASDQVSTELDVLRGARVARVTRWDDGFEMFSAAFGEADEAHHRVVPLEWLVAVDPSLSDALALGVGKGMRRDDTGPWQPWS